MSAPGPLYSQQLGWLMQGLVARKLASKCCGCGRFIARANVVFCTTCEVAYGDMRLDIEDVATGLPVSTSSGQLCLPF